MAALDTGATHHMTPHRHWLTGGYKTFPNPVPDYLGDDHRLNAKGVGNFAKWYSSAHPWHLSYPWTEPQFALSHSCHLQRFLHRVLS